MSPSDLSPSSPHSPRRDPREHPSADALADALERIERELLTLQRLSLVGRSAAMMAHELNNILTPILARSDDAAEHGDPERMRVALRKTAVQARRAIEVTRHFMAVGDAAGESRPCEVLDAVNDAIQTFVRPFEKEGVALTVSIDPQLRVRASPVLLHQLLFNLLLNARNALGGRKGTIRVRAARAGDVVEIEISDSGAGMPRDTLHNVVNPFLQADETHRPDAFPPVGLGLAVCRRIAHEHGATIELSEHEGPGLTVRIRWPAA